MHLQPLLWEVGVFVWKLLNHVVTVHLEGLDDLERWFQLLQAVQ